MQNKITYYQIDNLILNRVPFLFYNMGPSLKDWYQSINRMHVETYEQLITEDLVLIDLKQKNVPLDYAIVLLCPNGHISNKLAPELIQLSYTNVYVVDGGYQQMVTDRKTI